MIRYINFKGQGGQIETVDQLDSKDFTTAKDFRIELKRLINEYRLTGGGEYWTSQRACKDWK